MKFRELDEDHFNKLLQHYFLSPTAIAKGNIQLVLDDTDNPEHREQLRRASGAVRRIETIVHNMVETGEIKE